jgi:O-methyltransferase involved in polyketide biosynthesis
VRRGSPGVFQVVSGVPSRTAQATAAARAAHLVVDSEPWIFEDPLALALLDESADELLSAHRDSAAPRALASIRVAMTTRSRYTEARLAAAVDRGFDQYVLLGAGLDSFAYRSPLIDRLMSTRSTDPRPRHGSGNDWRPPEFRSRLGLS